MAGPLAIWAALQSAVLETFSPSSAYGAPALGGALAFSALYYVGRRRARGRRISVRGFLRSIFPRRILLHPSSLIDMRLWALNAIVFASAYGMLGLRPVLLARRHRRRADARLWAARADPLASLDRPRRSRPCCRSWPTNSPIGPPTTLFHKIPALWEFHKVHHSAEVMTTLTELRQHPVEIIAFMNLDRALRPESRLAS